MEINRSTFSNKLKETNWRIDLKTHSRNLEQINTPVAIYELELEGGTSKVIKLLLNASCALGLKILLVIVCAKLSCFSDNRMILFTKSFLIYIYHPKIGFYTELFAYQAVCKPFLLIWSLVLIHRPNYRGCDSPKPK